MNAQLSLAADRLEKLFGFSLEDKGIKEKNYLQDQTFQDSVETLSQDSIDITFGKGDMDGITRFDLAKLGNDPVATIQNGLSSLKDYSNALGQSFVEATQAEVGIAAQSSGVLKNAGNAAFAVLAAAFIHDHRNFTSYTLGNDYEIALGDGSKAKLTIRSSDYPPVLKITGQIHLPDGTLLEIDAGIRKNQPRQAGGLDLYLQRTSGGKILETLSFDTDAKRVALAINGPDGIFSTDQALELQR